MVLYPKEAGKFIAKNSKHVKILTNGIEKLGIKLINSIKNGECSYLKSEFCNESSHPKPTDPRTIDWIFIVDTLNFCFWSPGTDNESESVWTVNGQVGYFALCEAINRALKERIDILNPKYYSTISRDELAIILRSDDNKTPIPLLDERVKCLHEVGKVLQTNFNNTFETCLRIANNSAVKLLKLIVDNFPCFRDESKFNGVPVAFYKRAQILVADIWSCFYRQNGHNGQNGVTSWTQFYDIDEITMFADYRVPQILNYFAVLEYSTDLNEILKKQHILENGNVYECEIRGCSIEAIERLKNWIREKEPEIGKEINSILLDQYLWTLRRKINHDLHNIPFHRVISIYY